MDKLFAQLILARNDDVENWMNILFVVIIAVFWALGGLLKARARNAKKEESEEPQSDKPARKRPKTSTDLRKEFFKQLGFSRPAGQGSRQYRRQIEQLRRRITRPRPTSLSMGTEKKSISIPSEKERSKLTSEPAIELKDKDAAIQREMPIAAFTVESLLDYTDPDELRRAILHYEILGKPLSLRNPGEHII